MILRFKTHPPPLHDEKWIFDSAHSLDSEYLSEVSEIITDFGREPLTGVGLAICKV
jgi:hypothetical protein